MARSLLVLAGMLSLFLAACDSTPLIPEPPEIEETTFAESLGIDLSQMTRTESGLYYRDLEVGTGSTAQRGQSAGVRYTGWLADGTEFDSNRHHPSAFVFRIGHDNVIQGWHEGVAGMQVGGRRQLVIPPALAYGPRRQGGIPPNSILVFDVRLIAVQ